MSVWDRLMRIWNAEGKEAEVQERIPVPESLPRYALVDAEVGSARDDRRRSSSLCSAAGSNAGRGFFLPPADWFHSARKQ